MKKAFILKKTSEAVRALEFASDYIIPDWLHQTQVFLMSVAATPREHIVTACSVITVFPKRNSRASGNLPIVSVP